PRRERRHDCARRCGAHPPPRRAGSRAGAPAGRLERLPVAASQRLREALRRSRAAGRQGRRPRFPDRLPRRAGAARIALRARPERHPAMAVEVPSPGAAARATPVASRAAPRWLAPVVDYGPISIFTVAYCGFDVLTATAAMVVATIAALALSLALTRRVPITSLIVALTVIAFGGLTLWLDDERYLELQSTLINLLFSLVLWAALALRQPLLRAFFGVALRMTERGWCLLTISFAVFFAG